MEWTNTFLTVLGIFLYITKATADACTCVPSHPQDSFCKSDFVLRAKVKAVKTLRTEWKQNGTNTTGKTPLKKIYDIRVNKIYKAPEGYNHTSWTIYTHPAKACGVSLKKGRRYLLEGNIENGVPLITVCNWVKEWKEVPLQQRKGVKKIYGRHCDCGVHRCQSKESCRSKLSDNSCNWEWSVASGDCYSTYSICVRRKGECNWRGSTALKNCLSKLDKKKAKSERRKRKHPKSLSYKSRHV